MRCVDFENYVHFGDLDPGDVFISSTGKIVMKVKGANCPWNAVFLVTGELDCYLDNTLVYKVKASCTLED